jgi:glucose-1-phosphate thymidylyltransferase
MTKGIILAGGKGTRLYPSTYAISKQLLTVYNKPMIYYPMQTLIDMGIKDILIITADEVQCRLFEEQFKGIRGVDYDINLTFKIQHKPGGIPEAFIIGEEFIGEDDVVLVLGDNVIITPQKLSTLPNIIYTYKVKNPQAYGVAVIEDGELVDIVEKPKTHISDYAVIGLYTFTNLAVSIAKELKISDRGELEIVDLISKLNEIEGVDVQELDGFWFDCGNHDDLLECANLVKAIEHRTDKRIGL